MREPIKKCNCGGQDGIFEHDIHCPLDESVKSGTSEKITDETYLVIREDVGDGAGSRELINKVGECRTEIKTMLLTSAEKDAKIKQLQYDIEVAIEVHEQQDKDVADKIAKIKELESKVGEALYILEASRNYHEWEAVRAGIESTIKVLETNGITFLKR